ncbi:MAG: DUF2568 domain-containing protein [Woeseiaceae bacterium]|nr:DUF2568 domain-containing protein [Woeseiaceae bacterium]
MAKTAHPYDTPLSAGLRFGSELIAWVAGPWLAYTWSGWALLPALIALVALPGVFSTPGDKNKIVVPTPGPVRILIELLLYAVAAVAPWLIWPDWAAIAACTIVVLSIVIGVPRFVWLAMGARPKR